MVGGAVLVTGATGGLGRILASMLHAEGRQVVASGRNRSIGAELSAMGIHFMPADLVQDALEPLLAGVETVFHLAALSAPWGKPAAFETANALATRRLLEAARTAQCRRFIFASTPSIYTRAADQIGLTETSRLPPRFANAYARTKYAAERAVLAASADEFATVALRPRAIISPYDTALLPRLLRAANKGVLPLPGGGSALIEPTDARDAARAFLCAEAVASSVTGRAFNISGGVPLPVEALARHVFALLKREVRIIDVPRKAASFCAGAAEFCARALPGQPEPVLTRYGATVLGWSQTFDLTAARNDLAWKPRHAPLEAVDWALAEMQLA
ncbi:MAG TPA: NAD-dependent epimerase/dehydratase family protein [Sphingomonadaceae bacterium]|nr:NAD-dependent epimerase/dehydratase family protein [Sphingomonadaceae bacterium]